MQLYKITFLHVFGKAAKHPFRAAIVRTGALLSIGLGIGLVLAAKIPSLPLIGIDKLHVAYSAIFISQIVVSISLFTSFNVLRTPRKDRYAKLLLTLPITRQRVWCMLLLPAFIICLLSSALFGPLMCKLLGQLDIPLSVSVLILGIGNLTALGLALGLKKGIMTYATVPCLYLIEYKLLAYLNGSSSQDTLILFLLSVIFLLCIYLLGYGKKYILDEVRLTDKTAIIRTTFIPGSFWFIKKIVRTSSLRVGFCLTFAIAAALVIISKILDLTNEIYFGVCGALVTAVLAADVRTITRRYKPPEIFCLKGTKAFECSQLLGGIYFCALAASPVLIMSFILTPDPLATWKCALMILFGISAGFFAGSLIAPEPHDIIAQMSATLLSIGLLSLIYFVQDISLLSVPLTLLGLTVLLVVGGAAIEYKRNHFYWKEIP